MTEPARLADPLSALVREVNDGGRGLSYEAMAARAVDPVTGRKVSKQYLNDLAKRKTKKTPLAPELRAIAAGIGKPELMVKQAAAEQYLDYPAREMSGYSERARIIMSYLAGMDESELRSFQAVVEAQDRIKRESST